MIKNTRESPNNKREQHSPARPSLLAEPLSRVDDTTTKTKLHSVEAGRGKIYSNHVLRPTPRAIQRHYLPAERERACDNVHIHMARTAHPMWEG